MRNQSSDLMIPHPNALPLSHRDSTLSHRDSTLSKAYYEVHMTHVLHTAMSSNVNSIMFVNRIREMVSFEFGKEIEKEVFCLVTSVGQRKNSESPRAIEPHIQLTSQSKQAHY